MALPLLFSCLGGGVLPLKGKLLCFHQKAKGSIYHTPPPKAGGGSYNTPRGARSFKNAEIWHVHPANESRPVSIGIML